MSDISLKEDDSNIKFLSGLFNSDYPNPIRKQEFVLDYDCYSNFPMSIGEDDYNIVEIVKNMNTIVSNLFEKSITQELVKLMKK